MTIFYQLLPSEWLKQIYVDTSGATSHSALMCTIEMVGADHILWGSDCPGNPLISMSYISSFLGGFFQFWITRNKLIGHFLWRGQRYRPRLCVNSLAIKIIRAYPPNNK